MNTDDTKNSLGKGHRAEQVDTPARFITASSVLKEKVYNRGDEKLGEIKDIMINLQDGKIEYLIIEYGGFLGIGEKYFALPAKFLELNPKKEGFILNQSRDVLEKAPGFDKDHWPETNSHEMQETYTYWAGFMGPNTGNVQ